jgi:N-acetyl-gamma-glutamyl-phosphate reductase
MRTIAVIGATGYAGAELVRLLNGHPGAARLALGSTSKAGESLEGLYPNLATKDQSGAASGRLLLVSPSEAVDAADVVFSAQPSGCAEPLAAQARASGKLFIDLSADFRFGGDEATYEAWYGKKYAEPALHAEAVYGLPELNRPRIAAARIVGNPGCYPTASSLGLFPALRLGLARREGIVIDAASGVTGAGREPSRTTHYSDAADSITPYKIGSHRHIPEINAVLSAMAGDGVEAVFTPHLAPMGRGIVATIYFQLQKPMTAAELREAYAAFYAEEPFVRVLPEGAVATNRNVRLSNYCDISLHLAYGGKTAIVVSAIDNMVKGAAGQAIQNMNIALGLDERTGLAMLPPAF